MISCPPLHSCRVLPLGQGSRVPSNVVAPTVRLSNSLSYAALTMTSLKPTTRTRVFIVTVNITMALVQPEPSERSQC